MLIDHADKPDLDHLKDNQFVVFGGHHKRKKHDRSDGRMILYDSHRWKTIFRLRGSILPKALVYALVPSVLAFVMKLIDGNGWLEIPPSLDETAAYSTFVWTVGFLLVFRTSQCYTRFWDCAVGVTDLRSQMYEAISSLMSFCATSQHPESDVKELKVKIVQLFSLFHAMCMAAVSGQTHRDFPVICASLMPQKNLEFLKSLQGEARVEVAYQWICTLIMSEHQWGVLGHVPAPLMNGCLGELYASMREYATIHQIVTLPFPFPYSQVCLVMIMVYMITTPFAMLSWASHPFAAFAYTLMSATCFWSLEFIAAELENPFGDDVNDLPVFMFQDDVNNGLLLLIDENSDAIYELDESAKVAARNWHKIDNNGVTDKMILQTDAGKILVPGESLTYLDSCKPPDVQEEEVFEPLSKVLQDPVERAMERLIQQQEERGKQQADFEQKMLGYISGVEDRMMVVEEILTRLSGIHDTMTSKKQPGSPSTAV